MGRLVRGRTGGGIGSAAGGEDREGRRKNRGGALIKGERGKYLKMRKWIDEIEM